MHLKNFSLMHQPEGIVLNPAYDLLNVNLLNPKDEEELALSLNSEKKKIKLTDFKALAENLRINEKVYNNRFKLFSNKNKEVMDLIDRSFLDKKMKKGYKNIWMKKQEVFR
jgi:serine/threonine-protein kinase HipA